VDDHLDDPSLRPSRGRRHLVSWSQPYIFLRPRREDPRAAVVGRPSGLFGGASRGRGRVPCRGCWLSCTTAARDGAVQIVKSVAKIS